MMDALSCPRAHVYLEGCCTLLCRTFTLLCHTSISWSWVQYGVQRRVMHVSTCDAAWLRLIESVMYTIALFTDLAWTKS